MNVANNLTQPDAGTPARHRIPGLVEDAALLAVLVFMVPLVILVIAMPIVLCVRVALEIAGRW